MKRMLTMAFLCGCAFFGGSVAVIVSPRFQMPVAAQPQATEPRPSSAASDLTRLIRASRPICLQHAAAKPGAASARTRSTLPDPLP